MEINREVKDRVFALLFGAQYKENALALYNAMNNTHYTDTDDLTITTIDDVIYLGMKNDCSFLIDNTLSIFEQQSSINPNMPVRGLLYFGRLYDQYISVNHLNRYGRKRLALPTPQYIVLYNGAEPMDDITTYYLSESLSGSKKSDVEVVAHVYNINPGHNEDLVKACKPLLGFSVLISRMREYQKKTSDLEKAATLAVNSCIEDGILMDFLIKHKAEVIGMCLTEYDEAEQRKMDRQEGLEKGLEKGLRSLIIALKRFTPDFNSLYTEVVNTPDYADVSEEEVRRIYDEV